MKLIRHRPRGIDFIRLTSRRHNQLDFMIIENVNKPGKASCLRGFARPHLRHIRQNHSMKATGKFEIIVLRARTTTQCCKVKPNYTSSTLFCSNLSMFNKQYRVLWRSIRQLIKRLKQSLIRLHTHRRVITLHLLKRTTAIVNPGIDVQDIHTVLN